MIKVFCHKIFDGNQKPNWIHCAPWDRFTPPWFENFPPGLTWNMRKMLGKKNSHQQNWHIRWQCRSMFWSVWFLWYHVDTFPRLKGKKEICIGGSNSIFCYNFPSSLLDIFGTYLISKAQLKKTLTVPKWLGPIFTYSLKGSWSLLAIEIALIKFGSRSGNSSVASLVTLK